MSLSMELTRAASRNDADLYENVGRILAPGEGDQRDAAARAREWLETKRDWIRDAICGQSTVERADAIQDTTALATVIALLLMPPGTQNLELYASIAVLVARRGVDYWCNGGSRSDGQS